LNCLASSSSVPIQFLKSEKKTNMTLAGRDQFFSPGFGRIVKRYPDGWVIQGTGSLLSLAY